MSDFIWFRDHNRLVNLTKLRCVVEAVVLLILMAGTASAQLEPPCVENSPERRGEIGCSLVETKPLPDNLKEPRFWHIDSL